MSPRWEIAKALAMLATGCGVFMGFVLVAAMWVMPHAPQQINVTLHFDQPLQVKIVP